MIIRMWFHWPFDVHDVHCHGSVASCLASRDMFPALFQALTGWKFPIRLHGDEIREHSSARFSCVYGCNATSEKLRAGSWSENEARKASKANQKRGCRETPSVLFFSWLDTSLHSAWSSVNLCMQPLAGSGHLLSAYGCRRCFYCHVISKEGKQD